MQGFRPTPDRFARRGPWIYSIAMATYQQPITPFDAFNTDIDHQHFPEQGMAARAAEALVNSECWTDANPMLNLSSFVTTFLEPEARELMNQHCTANFADPDMYPHTKAAETHCVRWIHDLWNGPKDAEPYGAATIGSSEACMLA